MVIRNVKVILGIVMIGMVVVILYNIKNNNKIDVVTEEIKVKDLPRELDGFTILQLGDLHNKSFGNNQENLINIINEQSFDIIAICGDMQDNNEDGYDAFIKLLEGVKNKEIYYTPGNHGPYAYKGDEGFNNFLDNRFNKGYKVKAEKKLTEVGKELEELGVKFLDKAYEIKRGDKSVWISELLYKEQLSYITSGDYKDNGLNIAITHYPMNKDIYEGSYGEKMPKYDVVLAGHYHGGQWRIPGIGALFIPDLNQSGLFPSQERVNGLTEWGRFKQYVTKGLGAGGPFDFIKFRFFNKPEINLIKFVRL